jgi:hypothetical protein
LPQDEKDAAIGRVVRERTDVQKQISSVRAELRQLGKMLWEAGRELENYPEKVKFNGAEGNIKYASTASAVFDAKDIDGSRIMKRITDLRGLLDKLDKLNEQAKGLGIDS